jgi:hypothetical protein
MYVVSQNKLTIANNFSHAYCVKGEREEKKRTQEKEIKRETEREREREREWER